MTASPAGAQELSREECLALLKTAPFGRLVFTEGALPAVMPVDFVLDPEGIVVRTRPGGAIATAAGDTVVGFQVDDIDVERRSGWTVTVIGRARVVHDPLLLERLRDLPLLPWVPGDRSTFLAISVEVVNGRRIGGAEPRHLEALAERAVPRGAEPVAG